MLLPRFRPSSSRERRVRHLELNKARERQAPSTFVDCAALVELRQHDHVHEQQQVVSCTSFLLSLLKDCFGAGSSGLLAIDRKTKGVWSTALQPHPGELPASELFRLSTETNKTCVKGVNGDSFFLIPYCHWRRSLGLIVESAGHVFSQLIAVK